MKIKIRFATSLCACLLLVARPRAFPALLLSVTLHELGHILVARRLGLRFSSLSLSPIGAALTPLAGMGGYREEVFVAFAGPAANLLSVILLPKAPQSSFLHFFVIFSTFLGLLNLLPIRSFDGGRILLCTFSRLGKPLLGERILAASSFLFLFFFWSFSAYLLLRVGASLSLFVFSCSLFCRLFLTPSKPEI